MDEAEVERQIDQMVRFIRQEAEEKAAEIAVAAEEEFNIEKLTMVDAATASLRREYERREAGAAVSGKVAASKAVSAARLTVLRAQDAALAKVVASARARAAGLSKADPAAYERLLTDLAAQAVHALAGRGKGSGGTPSSAGGGPVRLRVRAEDAVAAAAALGALPARYAALYGGASPPAVQLDEANPLPPGPPPGAAADGGDAAAAGRHCAGGVVAVSADGRVSVPNTLDARLAIACEQTLPAVRAALFE